MCFINVQCHVMRSISWCSDVWELWLISSCSCLLEAEGCRGGVQRAALCHLWRAVPRLFPAQMEVKASLSLPYRPRVAGNERAAKTSSKETQEVLFSDVFMSAGDETQQWSFLNGDLEKEAVHSFCTLNGSSHPQSCEEAIVAFMAVAVESLRAAGRILDSPLYVSLSDQCQLVLSF